MHTVAQAYWSVADMKVSAGDEIVIYVLNTSEMRDDDPTVDVFYYLLMK